MNFLQALGRQCQEFSASPGKGLISLLFFLSALLGRQVKNSLRAVAHVAVYFVALKPVTFLVCVIFTFQEAYKLLEFFILWCIQSDVALLVFLIVPCHGTSNFYKQHPY